MPKLLFVSQYPFYPDVSGGSEHSSHFLFKSLRQMGWQIEVICSRDLPIFSKLLSFHFWKLFWESLTYLHMPFPISVDQELGYTCRRIITNRFTNRSRWIKFIDCRLREYQPDVVLGHSEINCPLLKYAANQGYQTVYFIRHVEDLKYEDNVSIPNGYKLLANSPFAASVIARISNRKPEVILPFVDIEHYRVDNRQRKYITFINLIPEKGVNVAIDIARKLPQERFLFVKGKWTSTDVSDSQNSFLEEVYKLSNVEVWEYQKDMRHVYAVTDILLVPSQFNETFGRVIVEAQVNNIPVVAADIGGISYTLGRGGILIDHIDEPQAYIDALKRLLTNEILYAELSELAFKNSQRIEFNAQYQVKKFIQFVDNYIK